MPHTITISLSYISSLYISLVRSRYLYLEGIHNHLLSLLPTHDNMFFSHNFIVWQPTVSFFHSLTLKLCPYASQRLCYDLMKDEQAFSTTIALCRRYLGR